MKILKILILVIVCTFILMSENYGQSPWDPQGAKPSHTIYRSGNVGIGTTPKSTSKLDVVGGFTHMTHNSQSLPPSEGIGGLTIGWNRSGGNAEVNFYNVYDGNIGGAPLSFLFSQKTGASTAVDLLAIRSSGNVGIGTTSPLTKLDVSGGDILLRGIKNFTKTGDEAIVFLGDGNHFIKSGFAKGVTIGTYGIPNGIFLQQSTGNVGIGTDLSSNNKNYKLSVGGEIRARGVVVEIGWADFVFEKNYLLRPLKEVEQYIKENGHLPEIPSAKEIEQNGANLGELLKLQMQKIEELTLYILEQEKRIKTIENQLNSK